MAERIETDEGHTKAGQDDIPALAAAIQERAEFADLPLDQCRVIAEKMIGEGMSTTDDWPHRPTAKRYTQMGPPSQRLWGRTEKTGETDEQVSQD